MIEVQDLVFEYPGKRALDGVSFGVEANTITALVGPNGAGKSTLLRCLAGLARPLGGSIRMGAIDVLDDPRECHRRLGYMSDFFGLYGDLTARQCLQYLAFAHGFSGEVAEAAVERAASRLALGSHLGAKAGALSRGLRQRLAIAQAILHDPQVLLLDEPASGLDPGARIGLAELFVSLRAEGVTVVVSSHILAELDQYSSHVMILRQGRVVEHRALVEPEATRRVLRVTLSHPVPELREKLAAEAGVVNLQVEDTEASFEFLGDPAEQQVLLRSWIEQGLPICSFGEEKKNLQDAYLATLSEVEPNEIATS